MAHANALTQNWFKPVIVVKNVATATWHEGDTPHEVKVELSLEQLHIGAQTIMRSGYRWQENRAEATLTNRSGSGDQPVGYIPEGGDVDLAVLNLEEHYMTHSDMRGFLHSITVQGEPVDALPPSYRHRSLAIRRAVLTLVVRHLLAGAWQQSRDI